MELLLILDVFMTDVLPLFLYPRKISQKERKKRPLQMSVMVWGLLGETYPSVPVIPESIDALVETNAEGEGTCKDGGDVYA